MKASVAPISLETSISSRWVRICSRMVLKVTATSASAEQHGEDPHDQARPSAATRRAGAPTRVELHVRDARPLRDFARAALSAAATVFARCHDKRVGQRILRQSCRTTSASPLDCFNSCSACSRGTKRKRCTRASLLQPRFDRAISRAARIERQKALICGSRGEMCRTTACRLSISAYSADREAQRDADHEDVEQTLPSGVRRAATSHERACVLAKPALSLPPPSRL